MSLYSINNLKSMEVIDINTGSKLGYIKDLVIDTQDYRILSLVIPKEKDSWFSRNNNLEIQWNKIVKVGVDVIIADVENHIIEDK